MNSTNMGTGCLHEHRHHLLTIYWAVSVQDMVAIFLQECKGLNARLITFLKSRDAVYKLVSYVIEPAKTWASERQQQRFPFIACEVGTGLSKPRAELACHMLARGYNLDVPLQIETCTSGSTSVLEVTLACLAVARFLLALLHFYRGLAKREHLNELRLTS